MKIGELARLAQCSVETVRYYEKAGLLPPAARSDSNYRHYGDAHVARLRFIRNCRALDMTHEEVRALLGLVDQPENSCSGVNRVLDEHIAHVDVRIRELRLLKISLRLTCIAIGSRLIDLQTGEINRRNIAGLLTQFTGGSALAVKRGGFTRQSQFFLRQP